MVTPFYSLHSTQYLLDTFCWKRWDIEFSAEMTVLIIMSLIFSQTTVWSIPTASKCRHSDFRVHLCPWRSENIVKRKKHLFACLSAEWRGSRHPFRKRRRINHDLSHVVKPNELAKKKYSQMSANVGGEEEGPRSADISAKSKKCFLDLLLLYVIINNSEKKNPR